MNGERSPQQMGMILPDAVRPETASRKLLERVDELVDFQFVRPLVAPYFSDRGRPSVDAVVMVKMMLVGYLFGVPSDRRLADECADRLSFRDFLGFNLDEKLPHHSDFTNWRKRLGQDFFRKVLHEIVKQCAANGMPIGQARTVDGTQIKAQADTQGPTTDVPTDQDVREYLDQCFSGDSPPDTGEPTRKVNTHDPDAQLSARPGQPGEFGYSGSFSTDADTGIICDATAKPREEASTAADHVDHDPIGVTELAADKLYDTGEALDALQERGVTPYVPRRKTDRKGTLSKDLFEYDETHNLYICPAGKQLRQSRHDPRTGKRHYVARASDCRQCPLKDQCTKSKRRSVVRIAHEAAREKTIRSGPRYEALMRKRSINEHVNMLGKRDHNLSRARALGLDCACIQVCLTAAAINLKKLVAWASDSAHFARCEQLLQLLMGTLGQLRPSGPTPVTARA